MRPLKSRLGAEPFGWESFAARCGSAQPKTTRDIQGAQLDGARPHCYWPFGRHISHFINGLPRLYGQWAEVVMHEC